VKLKLSQKLIISLASIFIIASIVLMGINLMQLGSVSHEKASLQAREIGNKYTSNFQALINNQVGSLQTLANTISQLHISGKATRDDIIAIVEKHMLDDEQIFYVNLAFEPDGFDGKDNEYQFLQMYSNDKNPGRFAISIIESGKNTVRSTLANLEEGSSAQFYVLTKERGNLTRLDPINYGTETNPLLYSSINAPIFDRDGSFIGVIGYMMSLNMMQEMAAAASSDDISVALLSQGGKYVSNGRDAELLGALDEQFLANTTNLEKLAAGEMIEETLGDRMYHVIPLPFADTDDTWYIQIATSIDYITAEYNRTRLISIAVTAATAILFIGVIIVLIRRWVLFPLRKLNQSLGHMASGDLTQKLDIHTKDEFGEMATHFNQMGDHLRDMFRHVTDLSLNVSATSQQMSASSQQTAKASENIAHAIDRVATGAETQHGHALTTSAEMKEMAAGVARIAESSSIAATSSQIAEENTLVGRNKMQETVEQMGELQQAVEHSNDAITALAAKSNEIKQITELIATISQQTNLLALNAAIEASRVGEHGRGFAVVASEIRNLADQTKQANENIAALIEEVYKGTITASQAMENGTKQMSIGITSVHEVGQIFSVINAEVQRVNEQISEVSAAAEQLHAGSLGVSETVEQFAGNASSTMNDAAEVAAASEEQLASMQEVATSSESLSVMVQELMERIARFKI